MRNHKAFTWWDLSLPNQDPYNTTESDNCDDHFVKINEFFSYFQLVISVLPLNNITIIITIIIQHPMDTVMVPTSMDTPMNLCRILACGQKETN